MSTVFKGKYGPIPVALKQAKYSVQQLLNEAQIITKIYHPNVIRVFGVWENAEKQMFMVFIAFQKSRANIDIEVCKPHRNLDRCT